MIISSRGSSIVRGGRVRARVREDKIKEREVRTMVLWRGGLKKKSGEDKRRKIYWGRRVSNSKKRRDGKWERLSNRTRVYNNRRKCRRKKCCNSSSRS